MQYRPLGTTGIQISAVSFGAGPVSALMTDGEAFDRQRATIGRAIESGINWFDTAPTYGDGQSESSLGKALAALSANEVHIATKVRLPESRLGDIRGFVLESFAASLARLQRPRVTMIQLHNSITGRRGELPTSITPDDVLGPGGLADAFEFLKRNGQAAHLGLTGIGHVSSLIEVMRSRIFAAIQVPLHVLNPSAATTLVPVGLEANYGNIMAEAERLGMGVLAIRVFAAGALVGQPPSDHTRKTKFFPLSVYETDQRRAAALARELPAGLDLKELALRYVLGHKSVSSAIVGFSTEKQIDEALTWAGRGPLDPELIVRVDRWVHQQA